MGQTPHLSELPPDHVGRRSLARRVVDVLRLGDAPRRGTHRPKTLFSLAEPTLHFVAEDGVEEGGGVAFDLPLLGVFLGFVPCARCRLRVGDGEAGVHRF